MKHALALCLALPLLSLAPHPGHAQGATVPTAKRARYDMTPSRLHAPTPGQALPVAPPFSDVPRDHWAFASVEALRKASIITGESAGRHHGK